MTTVDGHQVREGLDANGQQEAQGLGWFGDYCQVFWAMLRFVLLSIRVT
jgi:hypothetical protein